MPVTSQQVGQFIDSVAGHKRTARGVSGRLIEEVTELCLACGLNAGEILAHVTDALHNQALKASQKQLKTVFPSEVSDNISDAPGELADVGLVAKDLAYILNVDQESAETQKWADFITRDFRVSGNGTLYAKKTHIK